MNPGVVPLLFARTPAEDVSLSLLILLFGLGIFVVSLMFWLDRWTPPTLTRYRDHHDAIAAGGVFFGPPFILGGLGATVDNALHWSHQTGVLSVLRWFIIPVLVASFLYMVVYQVTGVPECIRPPRYRKDYVPKPAPIARPPAPPADDFDPSWGRDDR